MISSPYIVHYLIQYSLYSMFGFFHSVRRNVSRTIAVHLFLSYCVCHVRMVLLANRLHGHRPSTIKGESGFCLYREILEFMFIRMNVVHFFSFAFHALKWSGWHERKIKTHRNGYWKCLQKTFRSAIGNCYVFGHGIESIVESALISKWRFCFIGINSSRAFLRCR